MGTKSYAYLEKFQKAEEERKKLQTILKLQEEIGASAEAIKETKEKLAKLPPMPNNQQMQDAKDLMAGKLSLRERFQKMEKKCAEKEAALVQEEEMSRESSEEHMERCRKIREQSSIHLADTKKRRQDNAERKEKIKGDQEKEMVLLEQAFAKTAAEEAFAAKTVEAVGAGGYG